MRARNPEPISSKKKMMPWNGRNSSSQSAVAQRLPVGRAAEADVQEEADEEQLLQSPQHVRELLRAAMIGEHRAKQQRAELRAQAERARKPRRRRSRAPHRTARAARRDRKSRAATRSAGRASGNNSSSKRPRRRRLDVDRPRAAPTATMSCTIRMPIATRPCTARSSRLPSSTFAASTVLEKPSAIASTIETPREARTPINEQRAEGARQEQMHDGGAPDFVAQQRLDPQLQTDREQQQQDARMRELAAASASGSMPSAREHETRRQEADERRQPDPPCGKAEDKCTGYPDGEPSRTIFRADGPSIMRIAPPESIVGRARTRPCASRLERASRV